MTKAKHTPGPWQIGGVTMEMGDMQILDPSARVVIAYTTNAVSFGEIIVGAIRRREGRPSGDCYATQRANTQLIAASPDLLAACRVIVQAELYDPATGIIDADALEAAQEVARAAIAKAEGTAP